MRALILIAALALAACETLAPEPGPAPLPTRGPILYTCADGTQLTVDFTGNQARVAIIGGVAMVLPNAGPDYYSNGRYAVRGRGASTSWEVGRAAPVQCRGS